MTVPAAPSVPCKVCSALLTVVDDVCSRCGKTYGPRELWDRYQDLVRVGPIRFAK